MGQPKEINWPRPTFDEALIAATAIAHHYSYPFSKIDVGEPIEPERLTDEEAAQRLLNLADRIMDGTINSHIDVAKMVRTLGHKISPMGSLSTQIDLAAFRVSHAILLKQETFQE